MTKGSSDETLRRAFLGDGGSKPSADCPPGEKFWAACRYELSPAEIDALLAHALECEHCTTALAMAREVVGGMEQTPPVATGFRWGRWVGVAAAAAVIVLAVLIVPRFTGPDAPVMRGTGGETPQSLLEGSVPLPREAFVLRWSEVESAAGYHVELVTTDLKVLDRAENLRETSYRVPAERLEGVAAGTLLRWRVDAVDPDGAITSSPVFRVTIAE